MKKVLWRNGRSTGPVLDMDRCFRYSGESHGQIDTDNDYDDNDPGNRISGNDDYSYDDYRENGDEGDDDSPDSDSGLGEDDDDHSETKSIDPNVNLTWEENGRKYHKYDKEEYYPNPTDAAEMERQYRQHKLFYEMLGRRLQLAPVDWDSVKTVFDAGAGTGSWALAIADLYGHVNVIGVDLADVMPKWTNPRCKFFLDNVEKEFIPDPLDFVFARAIEIKNWPAFIRRAWEGLNPGGWLEIQNVVMIPQGELPEHSSVGKWAEEREDAMKKTGRSTASALLYEQQMLDAGFIRVERKVYRFPVSGKLLRENPSVAHLSPKIFEEHLEGFTMALFTRQLQRNPMEVYHSLHLVRDELRKTTASIYFEL